MAISASYVKFAGKNWYLIILLWIVVMIVGALHGPSFFNNTDDVMPETANTPSAEANDIMRKFFPASIDYTPWVLVIQCPEKETTPALLVEETGPFMSPAEDAVMKGCDGADGKPVISKDIKHMIDEIQQTLFDRNPDTFEPLLTVSYWSLAQSEYTKLLPRFLSEDGRTTYVQWSAKKSVFSSIRQKAYYSTLRSIIPKYRQQFAPSAYVYVTGGDPLTRDVTSLLMKLMLKTNAVIIPVALSLLIYMVGSWRLLLITAASLGLVVFGAFGISDLIANMMGSRPPSITTQMIEVISVAITIDYALFIFTRFVSEVKVKRKRWFIRHRYYLRHYASHPPELSSMDYLKPPHLIASDLTSSASFLQSQEPDGNDPHDLDVAYLSSSPFSSPTTIQSTNAINAQPPSSPSTTTPPTLSHSLSSLHPTPTSMCNVGNLTEHSGEVFMGLVINPALDGPYDPAPEDTAPSNAIVFSALVSTIENSGHVVLVSGSTLVVAFSGFLISRNLFLIQPALFTAIGVILSMLSVLTLVPALVQLFPAFFSDFNFFPAWVYRCCKCQQRRRNMLFQYDENGVELHNITDVFDKGDDDYDDYKDIFENDHVDASSSTQLTRQDTTTSTSGRNTNTTGASVVNLTRFHKSLWYRFGRHLVRKPYNFIVLLVLYGIMAYLASYIWQMNLSSAYSLGLPRGSKAYEALQVLQSAFPAGLIQPFFFTLVLTPHDEVNPPGPVFQDKLFQLGSKLVQQALDHEHLTPDNFMTPFYWDGEYIDTAEKASILLNNDKSYQFVWLTNVSQLLPYDHPTRDPVAVRTVLFHSISPENSKIIDFIRAIRKDVVAPLNTEDDEMAIFFTGYKPQEVDSIDKAQATFPLLLIVTTIMVITVVAMLLKSVFVPVRLLLTLVLPIGATFGLAVIIYQKGILNWTKISCVHQTELQAFFWNIPVFSAIVLISLALDYDLFLILRIMEYRSKSFTNRASILLALYDTGSIINSAGIIMALTFSSLLFFPADAVNQLGWLLVSSVLVDTFIVRPIIVPCVMEFADRISWWPSKVPWVNLKDVNGVVVVDENGNKITDNEDGDHDSHNSKEQHDDSFKSPLLSTQHETEHGDIAHSHTLTITES